MRVLITGGAGFIGSNLADAFLERDDEVLIVDNLSSGSERNVPSRARLEVLDIRDDRLGALFASFAPELLCHHAAQIDVRQSVADPAADADVNITGTIRLLHWCRAHGTNRVLFASTGGALYGEQSEFPASERHATLPASPYGIAKLAAEHYMRFYRDEYGLETTCLRYSNVYGPRQNAHGEAGVVAIFCNQLLSGTAPTIFGDGEQTRDFVFVEDVVRANLLALDNGVTGSFNVGTGVETSVNEIAETVVRHLAPGTEVLHGPGKPGEQRRSSIDAGALGERCGWVPQVLVSEGLQRTADWFKEQAATV